MESEYSDLVGDTKYIKSGSEKSKRSFANYWWCCRSWCCPNNHCFVDYWENQRTQKPSKRSEVKYGNYR